MSPTTTPMSRDRPALKALGNGVGRVADHLGSIGDALQGLRRYLRAVLQGNGHGRNGHLRHLATSRMVAIYRTVSVTFTCQEDTAVVGRNRR